MVHWPWQASAKFKGKSRYGIYGDAVEEIDWGVGEILNTLRETGLEKNTLVIFTSDNGGALRPGGGSNGLLRGGKGSIWEGGFREPFLARWPGKIPAGAVSADMACTMDLFATFIELAGGRIPSDRPIDGINVWRQLQGGPGARQTFYYFNSDFASDAQLRAVRSGKWKLHFRKNKPDEKDRFDAEALFDLERDPAEKYDAAREQPELVARLTAVTAAFHRDIRPATACPPLPAQYRKAGG
jgi:arylsulfatase A-like enzyme